MFRTLMPTAERCGVTVCLEPMPRYDSNFVNTVREGVLMVDDIGHSHFKLVLDINAMSDEGRPLDNIIGDAKGYVGHFHANDANTQGGPGWGVTPYGSIVKGLSEIGYDDYASVEVFDFHLGAECIARMSLEFLRRVFCAPSSSEDG